MSILYSNIQIAVLFRNSFVSADNRIRSNLNILEPTLKRREHLFPSQFKVAF